jgi:hypothetical protein
MGQLQSLLKLNSSGFEKMKEKQTPPCSRKILSDPRSPTVEVCRTPIETLCSQNENTSTPKTGKSFMSLRKCMAERDNEKKAVISSSSHN